MLASELKELELNGFVERKVLTSTPVVVEYSLTDYARTLDKVLDALNDCGARHREK